AGILTASSGPWLTVFTGRDNALNGQLCTINQMTGQRANQISDDVYGPKPLNHSRNPAAFAQPTPGTFGNHVRASITGPGQWVINTALSRMLTFFGTQNVEFRVEAFNLLNHFNWGLPATNLQQGTFGRITSQATDPRILQFGVKYAFYRPIRAEWPYGNDARPPTRTPASLLGTHHSIRPRRSAFPLRRYGETAL